MDEMKVLRGLTTQRRLEIKGELIENLQECIVISEATTCDRCFKVIGELPFYWEP